MIDGVGVAPLRPLLLPGRQRRQRPFTRARIVAHRRRDATAARKRLLLVIGGYVTGRHLLIVRYDLQSDGHQISGPQHLLLLQTARMLMVIGVEVMIVFAQMGRRLRLATVLVRRQAVRRAAMTFAGGSRTRP